MTRRKRWLLYAAVFGAIQVAGCLYLSSIISPYPDVREPPQEVNRRYHPRGFSIVKPGRTQAMIMDDMLAIVPDGGRSRYTAHLSVRRLTEPPDVQRLQRDGFQPGSYQGRDAYVYTGPSGKYDSWNAITNRGGAWYMVSLSVPGRGEAAPPLPSPQWLQYLNTFAAPE